jgi:hypothetical protein
MKEKDSTKYRSQYEHNVLNKRQCARFIALAKTPAERKVYRDMLNGPEFHKPRDRAGRKTENDTKETQS